MNTERIELKRIEYGTEAYAATLELRNEVMRKPLGRNIADEDFSCERNMIVLGAFGDGALLGVCVLSHADAAYKVEYLCVGFAIQGKGIGGKLLGEVERIAREAGGETLELEARCTAQPFYESHGLVAYGERYLHIAAPVDHIRMAKSLR